MDQKRISVVGTTGSGKTTVAQALAKRLDLPYIELDALYWDENWTCVPEEIFLARVMAAVQPDRWVIDGNYSRTRRLVWERAEAVVYLDYSFGRTFWQLLKRTLQRSIRQETLWNDNRESLRNSVFCRDSILMWMLTTYRRRRRQYAQLMAQPEYEHLQIVHLKTVEMTDAWLSGIPAAEPQK